MGKQARILSDARLKQAITATANDRERAMLLLSLKAGMRAVEIAGLNWAHIDFEGRTLLLSTTKGDKPRHVPIARDLFEALHTYRATRKGKDAKGDRVFVNTQSRPGAALTPNSVAVWFRDFYCRRLGWEKYSSHSGRRSFATNVAKKIVEAKGSLRDVQALLGHESLNSTQRYIETDEDAQRKVVDLI